ncbi:selT-like protein [Rhodamnia argentea]|uniref:SelT-like protein n=1 Tax=Rhodamnia argentea TaxID=178133 RepID=A0A8B8PRK4_9MYRT|nr:selT-like protein [Rhodamnia argentea]
MDRGQILLLGLPLFLLCSDLVNLFTPPPPKPPLAHRHRQPHHHNPPEALEFPAQLQKPSTIGGIGLGSTVVINFCSSCSYRGTAVTMKKMLETQFPGIDVVLANYPPPLPKRILAKLVPVAQIGVFAIIMAGEHIFPMVGIAVPPPWYYSLRANRFGTIASTWLLGNVFQSFLQSSGAFEVHCNDELVFSKLKEGRFPGEIELKDLVGRRLANSRVTDGLGGMWS